LLLHQTLSGGHTAIVNTVANLPDHALVSGGADRHICIWRPVLAAAAAAAAAAHVSADTEAEAEDKAADEWAPVTLHSEHKHRAAVNWIAPLGSDGGFVVADTSRYLSHFVLRP
jgi:hypothetical protein